MSWIGDSQSHSKANHIINAFLILTLFISFLLFAINTAQAISNIKNHNNITGNITDLECIICHPTQETLFQSELNQLDKPLIENAPNINSLLQVGENYTAILTSGQTPYQLGPFFRSGANGWSWLDTGAWGTDRQKNLILLSIFDNSTGSIKPVQGLTSWLSWPQASFRNHSGTYSYKADNGPSPITIQRNYPDASEFWMIKEINLSGLSTATLNFWTWYSMETDWDYGYVAISSDGNSWINLQGNNTTNTNPNGNNLGNGITGNSGGIWVYETMDLTSYVGKKMLIGFRFVSDAAVNEEGMYIDDITATGGFSDDAETLIEIKTLSVNVTYPRLAILNPTDPMTSASTLQYNPYVQKVELHEDISHPGTYAGYFQYEPFGGQYSGKYTVYFDTAINGERVIGNTTFDTTIFGCQDCHNKNYNGAETSFVHADGGGMQSCEYVCHSGSRGLYDNAFMGPPLPANPIHVHEMKFGHQGGYLTGAYYSQPPYNVPSHVTEVSCVQCHTSFIHDNTGSDTAKIGNYTLYGTNINFSSGTHSSLTCEQCHGDLNYPAIPQDQYSITNKLGNNSRSFSSSVSFTDTYAVDVNGIENLTIDVHADDGSTKLVAIYVIGPVDNTTTGIQGPNQYGYPYYITQSLSTPINVNVVGPFTGTWLVKLYSTQEGVVDYTITSSYPIERKPIIKIPECNECHNSGSSDKTYAKDPIPNWNPGFAHVDTNNDGNLDVQCRMCHNAMHDITVKACLNCHTTAPTGHPISEPAFSQYTQAQCLSCHGDPHRVTMAGGGCIGCHSNPDTRYYVNTSLFVGHANVNASGGPNNVTDADCMTCHFGSSDIIMSPDAGLGGANHNNTWFCDDCHTEGGSGPLKSTILKSVSHGSTDCKWCHIAGDPLQRPLINENETLRYHPNGPKGTAAGQNCLTCHVSGNLPDLPFHAPGESHSTTTTDDCSEFCHQNSDPHRVTPFNAGTLPTISGLTVTTPVTSGTPVLVQATIKDDYMQIAAAQYRVTDASGEIIPWTNMTPVGGRFSLSTQGVSSNIITSNLKGTYTVYVKGMASAYKTNPSLPYYSMNGQWSSGVYSAQFKVEEPEGYGNGTVYGILDQKIAGAIVSTNTSVSTITDQNGAYSLSLPNGTYRLTASKEPEYYPNSSVIVTVTAYTTVNRDIILTPKPTGNISGTVRNK